MTAITVRQLKPYFNNSPAPTFVAGLFPVDEDSFKNSEKVAWDVEREEEDVAVPLPSPDSGSRHNETGDYDDKEVIPPNYSESGSISASSLGKSRQIGKTEYDDPGFLREAGERASRLATKLEKKLRRGMELQGSQILTDVNGISLVDGNGVVMFALNYEAKASHFPNAGTAWGAATLVQKLGDVSALCNEVRNDGLEDPKRILIGDGSFENLINTDGFKDRFDARRADFGEFNKLKTGGTRGAHYRGTLDLESFKVDMWTYSGRYKHPETGLKTKFIGDSKLVVLADGRFQTVFGRVFKFNNGQAVPIPQLRRRAKMRKQGLDIFFNNWVEKNGSAVTLELSSRPLLIPIAIDTFGCLDTGI
jgi:hypothetical protein